jgi:CheY-like chemotaxis protein
MYTSEHSTQPMWMSDQRTLQHAERLAGGIAHDFNNLLMAIIGHTDLLSEYFTSGDPRAAEVQAIRQAADHAAALTRQLTAFSRRQSFHATVINLNDIVERSRRTLTRVAGEDVELEIVACDDLRSVKTDATQVEQVLLTLAVNARDAMPEGGRLTIRTDNLSLDESLAARFGADPGDYVELSVADNGIGMDADIQSHLFTPFFTTKERGHGTGLGLATVHGIVTQSGGHITVDSAAGRGSRFGIRFPSTAERASSVARERLDVAQRGTETVLLVEDDGAVRGLMADVLRKRGYEVLVAPDGFEAVRVADLHDAPIQLLVTDVVMRDMSGVDVAIELRARRPDLKVLYVSGYTNDTAVTTESDDHMYLPKPFTPDALARKVRAALAELRPRT